MTAPRSEWTSPAPRLHLARWGSSGAPILLAHGMAGSTHWWDDVAPLLTPGLSPAALDFHGHGRSDWLPDGLYGSNAWTQDIEDARRLLGVERFVLCGHSLGARVSMEYAARFPQRLSALILVDFLAERSRGTGEREFERARGMPQPVYPDVETMAKRFRLQPRATLLAPDRVEAIGRQSVRPAAGGGWTWNFDWKALRYVYEPVWPTLPKIRTPTLIVRGGRSTVFDRSAYERALALTPGARGVELAPAHHHVPLDTPRELAEAILSFLPPN